LPSRAPQLRRRAPFAQIVRTTTLIRARGDPLRRHHPKIKSRIRKIPAAAGHASVCLALQHHLVTALQYDFCNAARN
jgi:hypothetical protein